MTRQVLSFYFQLAADSLLGLVGKFYMARYLDAQALQAKLNFGKEAELFLGRDNQDKNIIGYLVLRKQNGKIGIYHYQCFDEGGLDYLDIYSFSEVEEKTTYQIAELYTIEDVVEFIKTKFALVEVQFVNQGVSQEEYRDLLQVEIRFALGSFPLTGQAF